jgi:hypothetical protein
MAEVRTCAYGDTAPLARQALATLPPVAVGHVVALHDAPGKYWKVREIVDSVNVGMSYCVALITRGASQSRWVHSSQIGKSWDNLNEAAGEVGAFHLHAQPEASLPARQSVHGWEHVNELRTAVKEHLHREERGKHIGYFALLTEANGADAVKFYRVRTGNKKGKWANHLFVDAQASDDFYPVRAKDTLTAVLEGILADPEGAALLYATQLGRCSRCNRTLTDETSRAYGIGPECRKKG